MKSKYNIATYVCVAIILAFTLYLGVVDTIYSFKNPEQTNTQRFLHLSRTIVWDWEP